jgi:hypothetical protein
LVALVILALEAFAVEAFRRELTKCKPGQRAVLQSVDMSGAGDGNVAPAPAPFAQALADAFVTFYANATDTGFGTYTGSGTYTRYAGLDYLPDGSPKAISVKVGSSTP